MNEEKNNENMTEEHASATQPATPDPATPTPASNASKMNVGIIVATLAIALLAVGAIYWFGSDEVNMNGSDASGLFDGAENQESAAVPPLRELPETVAEVNGVAISKDRLAEGIAQTEAAYAQQGGDPSSPAVAGNIRTQALETVVNNELLTQAATAAGIAVKAAAVEAELTAIQEQFADEAAFTAELEAAELTREQLREDVANQLLLDEYLTNSDALAALTAPTEEEARALYEQAVAQAGEEVPSFAEVRPQIEAQITQQNQQAAIAELIAELRADAEVELMI